MAALALPLRVAEAGAPADSILGWQAAVRAMAPKMVHRANWELKRKCMLGLEMRGLGIVLRRRCNRRAQRVVLQHDTI